MGKRFFKVLMPAMSLLILVFLVSCAKPSHQVYFKVSGVSNSTDIIYSIFASGSDALINNWADHGDITVSSLPWTSDTITVKQGEVASLSVDIYDSLSQSPAVTMEIYSDGSVVKSTTCSGAGASTTMQMTF